VGNVLLVELSGRGKLGQASDIRQAFDLPGVRIAISMGPPEMHCGCAKFTQFRLLAQASSGRMLVAALVLMACAPVAAGHPAPNASSGAGAQTDHDCGLPFFDARLDINGLPLPIVKTRIEAARANDGPLGAARTDEISLLRTAIPGLAIDVDELLGTPRYVRSTRAFLTPALPPEVLVWGKDGLTVVREFVAEHPALFEINPIECELARVSRDFRTDHNGVRHITLQQLVRGVDLFGCELRANLTARGELINIGSTMLPRPEGNFACAPKTFDDVAAIVIAAANVGITIPNDRWPKPLHDALGASMKRLWQGTPDFRSSPADEPLSTELVYFPLDRATIHPAWKVLVPTPGLGHTYEIIVDAVDGSILRRHDRLVCDSTQPVTMRVHTSDGIAPGSPGAAAPTGYQFPIVPRTLVTWNPSDVIAWSPSGWINDGGTETLGNNVDSHTDLDGDNIADTPRPNGGPSRVFDFPLDPAQEPASYSAVSVVEVFYRANWYHDRLMDLGFNEAAGNFQAVNFSGHGVAGDAIQADCQDSAGNGATGNNGNNANFYTGGDDGSSARVQMYLFPGPVPARDGALDGDIVHHELAHGTSIRLHHGLSGVQPQGLGEGWSDFFAVSLLAEGSDDPDGVYPIAGYTTYQLFGASYFNNYYFGIRRYPYCTDMSKNPLTFGFIDNAQLVYPSSVPRNTAITSPASAVHNVGEVWCSALLECRATLWHAHGFAGNERMMRLVVDAMKLSAANPNFIQARDAILQADLVNYAGADTAMLWGAFAKRGLGEGASSPAGSTTSGVVESFTIPPLVAFAYPDGLPSSLLPGVPTDRRVNITNAGLSPLSGTGTLHLSINGGAFTSIPLVATGTNEYIATIPAQACFTNVSYYFSCDTSGGIRTDPATAPTAVYRVSTFTGTTRAATDGFEVDSGWSVVNTPNPSTATMTGVWERAAPQATAAQPGGAYAGTLCFVTGSTAGASIGVNDLDNGKTALLSPVYDLSAYGDAIVSYRRWYSNGAGPNPFTNVFRVDVSIDGGANWTSAETLGPASSPDTTPGWRLVSWKLGDLGLTPTGAVRFRFAAEDLTAAIVEAALDEFVIDGLTCSVVTGACCDPGGACTLTTSAACGSGDYRGDGTACSPSPCTPIMEQVTVTKSGSGTGVVTGSPPGIACGGVCSFAYAHGLSLTLAATADANSEFMGWSGACSGTSDCIATISGPLAVTARFRCRGDFNDSGVVSVQDIFDFLNAWFSGDPRADFNGGGLGVQDIFDFLNAWFLGCG
jgi:hypothetical protein